MAWYRSRDVQMIAAGRTLSLEAFVDDSEISIAQNEDAVSIIRSVAGGIANDFNITPHKDSTITCEMYDDFDDTIVFNNYWLNRLAFPLLMNLTYNNPVDGQTKNKTLDFGVCFISANQFTITKDNKPTSQFTIISKDTKIIV